MADLPKAPSAACEYRIEFIPTPIDEATLIARMNELGADEWHLLFVTTESLIYQSSQNGLRLWFSRDL